LLGSQAAPAPSNFEQLPAPLGPLNPVQASPRAQLLSSAHEVPRPVFSAQVPFTQVESKSQSSDNWHGPPAADLVLHVLHSATEYGQ
jgi:hypothetical protein